MSETLVHGLDEATVILKIARRDIDDLLRSGITPYSVNDAPQITPPQSLNLSGAMDTDISTLTSDQRTNTSSGPSSSPERLTVSVAEAARMLGISRSAAYECAKTGALPSITMGRRVLVPLRALREIVENAQTRQS